MNSLGIIIEFGITVVVEPNAKTVIFNNITIKISGGIIQFHSGRTG